MRRLGGSASAGFFAVALVGLVSEVPGEYVNWGRYTQLAAQVILPGWLWALDVWWTEQERPSLRVLGLLGLLSGIALAHYRVAIVAVFAAIGWGLWALWLLRGRLREWLARQFSWPGRAARRWRLSCLGSSSPAHPSWPG